jgi:hypothetical protein
MPPPISSAFRRRDGLSCFDAMHRRSDKTVLESQRWRRASIHTHDRQ